MPSCLDFIQFQSEKKQENEGRLAGSLADLEWADGGID